MNILSHLHEEPLLPPQAPVKDFFGACLNVDNYQLNPKPSDFTGNVLPSLSPDLKPA